MNILDNPYNDSYTVKDPNGDITLHREEFTNSLNGNYTVHTVLEGQTIQDISIKYYGNSGGWYKIADFNKILNPFTELIPNMQLLIPL